MLNNPIYLALDVDSKQAAIELINKTSSWVGGYKIGPRLLFSAGTEWVRSISQSHSVFLDLKFYDIPNTMLYSVRSAFDLGVDYVTVHALAGHQALSELAALERELSQNRPFKVLSVSILTSYSQMTLPKVLQASKLSDLVDSLASEVMEQGLTGVVCSGEELQHLKSKHQNIFCVVPGVRPAGGELGDQKRVITPSQALCWGADMLVIGRPIYKDKNPELAAQKIYESLYEEK